MPKRENHKICEISDGKEVPQLKIGVGVDPFDMMLLESQYELIAELRGSDIMVTNDKLNPPLIRVRERKKPFGNLLTIHIKAFTSANSESFANHLYDCGTTRYNNGVLNGSWDHTLITKRGPMCGFGGKLVFLPQYNNYGSSPPFVIVIEPKALGTKKQITKKRFSGLGKDEIQGLLVLERSGDYTLCLVDCQQAKDGDPADFAALLKALKITVYGHKIIGYRFKLNDHKFKSRVNVALPLPPSPAVLSPPFPSSVSPLAGQLPLTQPLPPLPPMPSFLQPPLPSQRKRGLPPDFEAHGWTSKRPRYVEDLEQPPIGPFISQTVSAESLASDNINEYGHGQTFDFDLSFAPSDIGSFAPGLDFGAPSPDMDAAVAATNDLFDDISDVDFPFDGQFDFDADQFRFHY